MPKLPKGPKDPLGNGVGEGLRGVGVKVGAGMCDADSLGAGEAVGKEDSPWQG